MQKRGQATTFIVLGIVIIVLIGLLVFILRPQATQPPLETPEELITVLEDCLYQQLLVSITHPQLSQQPTRELAQQWIAEHTSNLFLTHCDPLIEGYPNAQITGQPTTSITIQGSSLNTFQKITAITTANIQVQVGNTQQQLPPLTAEVFEDQ